MTTDATPEPQPIPCDGQWTGCTHAATMIGSKGYAYCASCGPQRRADGRERVRKLTPAELRTLQSGQPLAAY